MQSNKNRNFTEGSLLCLSHNEQLTMTKLLDETNDEELRALVVKNQEKIYKLINPEFMD